MNVQISCVLNETGRILENFVLLVESLMSERDYHNVTKLRKWLYITDGIYMYNLQRSNNILVNIYT